MIDIAFTRAVAGPLFLRGFVLAASFLCQMLLARLLGVGGFGLYAYALAWTRPLAAPATLGLERLFVREVAACAGQSRWGEWRALLGWGARLLLGVSGALAIGGAIATVILAPGAAWAPALWLA
ncbi:MAG: hypothetical protein V4659_11080, partial [Pseudomonadota bacterium]